MNCRKNRSISKEQEKINELLKKDELTNRDVQRLSKLMEKEAGKTTPDQEGGEMNQTGTTFSVADSAVKNDSLYWNKIRPIPLTPEEHLTLKERDSIIGIQQAAAAPAPTHQKDFTQAEKAPWSPDRTNLYQKQGKASPHP